MNLHTHTFPKCERNTWRHVLYARDLANPLLYITCYFDLLTFNTYMYAWSQETSWEKTSKCDTKRLYCIKQNLCAELALSKSVFARYLCCNFHNLVEILSSPLCLQSSCVSIVPRRHCYYDRTNRRGFSNGTVLYSLVLDRRIN